MDYGKKPTVPVNNNNLFITYSSVVVYSVQHRKMGRLLKIYHRYCIIQRAAWALGNERRLIGPVGHSHSTWVKGGRGYYGTGGSTLVVL